MTSSSPLSALAVVCMFGTTVSTAHASEDTSGANILALGGAVAANPEDNGSITVNPGTLGLTSRYDSHAHFTYSAAQGMGWGASIMDSKTTKWVSFGIAYSGDTQEPSLTAEELPGWNIQGYPITNVKRYHHLTFATAVPFLDRKLSIGLNGTATWFEHDRRGNGTTGNMDFGLGYQPFEWFATGLALRNFIPIESPTDRPLGLLAGFQFKKDTIGTAVLDIQYDFLTDAAIPMTLGFGVEKVFNSFGIRAGYRYEGPLNSHSIAWGLGVQKQGNGMEYGMSIPVHSDLQFADVVHQISLRLRTMHPQDLKP